MPLQLINIQYCYNYLIDQIPVGLLLYSHIPTALIALLFGGFVLYKSRELPSRVLFAVSLFFALWSFVDLISWFEFIDSSITMFAWSLADLFGLIFFSFSYYFLYSFSTKKDLPLWQKLAGVVIILPTAIWTLVGGNLPAYDANTCEAIENTFVTGYLFYAEGAILLASVIFTIMRTVKSAEKNDRQRILLAGVGVSIFLSIFLSATLLASILVNYEDLSQYAYNFEIYGLFGMPVLLMYLGFLIVRYKAFNLKMFGAQALVLALVALIGSEFAFVDTSSGQILIGITLLLIGVVGILLTRSVKREIVQREHIEKLAGELAVTNERQETLIHFIGHEVKGFLTKDAGSFAALVEGDFGQLPEALKPFVSEALVESRRGSDSVTNILKASNLKKGTVTYVKEPFDLKALVAEAVEKAKLAAEQKGLAISFTADEGSYQMVGDKAQITDHVLRNLIDNAINYTPSGTIVVSLKSEGTKYIFSVKDSGIGITDADKQRLFTEGGHGADAQKINVHSTGYGLYIAKQITEAHGGTISAKSDGAGKGSTFVIEFSSEAK